MKLRLPFLIVILLLISCFPVASAAPRSRLVLVFDNFYEAAPYVAFLNQSYRVVVTEDINLTLDRLEHIGVEYTLLGPQLPNVFEGVPPGLLAYLVIYANSTQDIRYLTDRGAIKEFLSRKSDEAVAAAMNRKSNIAVVFYGDDGYDYSLLAAYISLLKGAKIIDMDLIDQIDVLSALKNVDYVIMVTKPLYSGNSKRYRELIEILTSLDSDPYLDASLGVITGLSIDTGYLLVLMSEILSDRFPTHLRGITLQGDIPLARKIEAISLLFGLNSKIVHPDIQYSNLSYAEAKNILQNASGILYLNLHGNPYVMALKTDGYVIITGSLISEIRMNLPIVLTLSCDTLRFADMSSPNGAIAYSLLDAGAAAYIGSTKAEFSIGSEAGTSYPDLIVLMLLSGYSLGEIVRTINNFHIREFGEKGITNFEAAYEILLGDPTLSLENKRQMPYEIYGSGEGVYRIKPTATVPTVFIRISAGRNLRPHVESDIPAMYFKWYSDEDGLSIYISSLSSSYAGYFSSETVIRIEIRKEWGMFALIPYLAIMLIIGLGLLLIARSARTK